MSPPYMPFYVGDYLADTGHLSAAENGAYLLLIMHYWRTGGLPLDDEMRRRVSRMTHREWQRSRDTVLSFFSDDGKHKRVDEELARVNHKTYVLRLNALKSHEARRANAQQGHLQNDCIPEPDPEPIEIRDADASLVNGKAVALSPVVKPKDENKEPLKAFGEAWNKLAASFSLPQIDEIKPGSARERQALARLREMSDHDELITRIRGSPYLRGEVNGFRCSFDWVVNASNFQKIMEGNYESRKEPQRHAYHAR